MFDYQTKSKLKENFVRGRCQDANRSAYTAEQFLDGENALVLLLVRTRALAH